MEQIIKSAGFLLFAIAFLYYANKIRSTPTTPEKTTPSTPKLPNLNLFTYITKPKAFSSTIPTVLVAFGTNCPPCRAEVPHLSNLQKTKNINIVAIAQEPKSSVSTFCESFPETKNYAVGADEFGKLRPLLDFYVVKGVPHAFVFDSDGKIAFNGHPRNMDSVIQKLCEKRSDFGGKGRKL